MLFVLNLNNKTIKVGDSTGRSLLDSSYIRNHSNLNPIVSKIEEGFESQAYL